MVQDMIHILNCKHRFLPRYGQLKAGAKLPTSQATAVRATLSKDTEATAKKRVEYELKHKGGFLPLMAHYPVLRRAQSGGLQEQQIRQQTSSSDSDDEEGDDVDNCYGPATAGAEADSSNPQAGGQIVFSERDKQLYVFMQTWWAKQRKLLRVRRRVRAQQGSQQRADVGAQQMQTSQHDDTMFEQAPVAA